MKETYELISKVLCVYSKYNELFKSSPNKLARALSAAVEALEYYQHDDQIGKTAKDALTRIEAIAKGEQ